MRNLTPNFIKNKYSENKVNGSFKASVLIVDISGFTKMTDHFMTKGMEGVEILKNILDVILIPSIEDIYKFGGFISSFGGDGFIALFEDDLQDENDIFKSGINIMRNFEKNGSQKTKFGKFDLTAKIGISKGDIKWNIIENVNHNVYYFFGEGIDRAAYFESYADSGDMIIDFTFLDEKFSYSEHIEKVKNKIKFNWEKYDNKKLELKPLISEKYIDDSIWIDKRIINAQSTDEFRDIISCFICFRELEELSQSISTIMDLIYNYGGFLNKIDFGDKGGVILVFFGAPVGSEKLPQRAVEFVNDLKNLKSGEFRIGISSGSAFCGFIGCDIRSEYTALGQVVNISSRFAHKAFWGDICVDEFIYESTKNKYQYELSIYKKFKGLSKDTKCYILKKKKDIFEFHKKTYENIFVGREEELETLTSFLKPLKENIFSGLIYIYGEPGTGKTRLVNEFKSKLLSEDYNWLDMHCDVILKKPFNPIIYFLNREFNQSEANSEHINKLMFEERIFEVTGSITEIKHPETELLIEEIERSKSLIGAMLKLYWENSLYEKLDPKSRYENTIHVIKNYIKVISLLKPLIINFEDYHSVDPDTENFLNFLMYNIESFPILILFTTRGNKNDEFNSELEIKNVDKKRIILKLLNRENSEKLTRYLLGEKINQDIENKKINNIFSILWKKTKGNPFYLEQMILYLTTIDETADLYEMSLNIPASLKSIILTRIDVLDLNLKKIVKVASAIGKEFSIEILQKVMENLNYQFDVNYHLDMGVKEQILSKTSDTVYSFTHELVRDVIYQLQLKSDLKKIHNTIGESIESIYGENERYYIDLVDHYEKAGKKEKTLEYLEKAIEYTKANYQNELSISLYEKLKSKIKIRSEKYVNILLDQGEILKLIGKWTDCEQCYLGAKTISEENNFIKLKGKSLDSLGNLYRLKSEYEKADKLLKNAMEIFKQLNDKEMISSIMGNLGNVCYRKGNYKDAINYYNECLEIKEKIGDSAGYSRSLINLGHIYSEMSNFDKALKLYRKSLNIVEKSQDKKNIGIVLMSIGIVYHLENDYKKAKDYYSKCLIIQKETGDSQGLAIVMGNIGTLFEDIGDFERALNYYNRGLEINKELGDKRSSAITLCNIGNVYRSLNEFEKSSQYYNKSIDISEEIGLKYNLSHTLWQKAELLFLMEDYLKAEEILEKAWKVSKEVGRESVIFSIRILKIKIDHALGKYPDIGTDPVEKFNELLNIVEDDENIAHINYEMFKISGKKDYKKKTLNIFKKLYKKVKKYDYKIKIEELEEMK